MCAWWWNTLFILLVCCRRFVGTVCSIRRAMTFPRSIASLIASCTGFLLVFFSKFQCKVMICSHALELVSVRDGCHSSLLFLTFSRLRMICRGLSEEQTCSSGTITDNRYTFQKNLLICKMWSQFLSTIFFFECRRQSLKIAQQPIQNLTNNQLTGGSSLFKELISGEQGVLQYDCSSV